MRSEHAIALIASRYENLNYTMLEAMAAGQAIVSTKVGGPAEVLEDGRTALLVPPGDPAAMAAALARLQADSALVSRLGQAAQDKLAQDFNPATVAARTVSFLKTALNRA
jgi:glycosyltransferase involved in cell wall biosynthesis